MLNRGWSGLSGTVVLVLCAGAAMAEPAPGRPSWCPQPIAASQPDPTHRAAPRSAFRMLAAKAARGDTVRIVAIGSSSTEGSDLADRSMAYPSWLERDLGALLGRSHVVVLNKGRGGETMTETVARFERDVRDEKPDLVVWQLGVNDIVRRNDMDVSERNIRAGMEMLDSTGAPVILMDTQLAPKVIESPTLDTMLRLVRAAAVRHKATVMSRYELMGGILKSGAASMGDLIRPDNLHMTIGMHACTGAVLARTIAAEISQVSTLDMAIATTSAP